MIGNFPAGLQLQPVISQTKTGSSVTNCRFSPIKGPHHTGLEALNLEREREMCALSTSLGVMETTRRLRHCSPGGYTRPCNMGTKSFRLSPRLGFNSTT